MLALLARRNLNLQVIGLLVTVIDGPKVKALLSIVCF